MKFVFWNSKKHASFLTILEILTHVSPDVLFLAETEEEMISLNLEGLKLHNYEHFENPGCQRITIIKKKETALTLSKQSHYYSAIRDNANDIIIISVHLPSQMYQHMDGLKSYLREFRNEIDAEFGNSLDRNILIIGDFNISPFEKPMIDFDGFSASNSKNLRKEAVHLRNRKTLYYNPTWTLYSNNLFPGTKYYLRPSGSSFDILEHHFLDQVIMSYAMSKKIAFESISVLEKTGNCIFFDHSNNKVVNSDHLPLTYEYKLT